MTRSIDSQMKKFDLPQILETALQCRSVFHSESDFQHHLAWEIHKTFKDAEVRLECPLSHNKGDTRGHCDIVVWNADEQIGIELKYKTKEWVDDIGDEQFELKSQGAADIGEYNFLKDIYRLEQWRDSDDRQITRGYAVLLTNDPRYWKPTNNWKRTNSAEFRIHEGQKITKKLSWKEGSKLSEKHPSFKLKGSYTMNWRDSPNKALLESKELSNRFRYLCVQVPA